MTPKPDLDAIERLLADCDGATALTTAEPEPASLRPAADDDVEF